MSYSSGEAFGFSRERIFTPPFFAAELGSAFDLSKNLIQGMLPIVLDSLVPEEILRAYAGIYLKEEVQAGGTV